MRRIRKAAAAGLAAFGLVWMIVTLTPVTSWWADALAGSWNEPEGDVLVILGNDLPYEGIIGRGSYVRCAHAVAVWRSHVFRTAVVTGGGGSGESMRDFLVAHGIPKESVVVEGEAATTLENALFAREALARLPGRKVLLTSDYHVYRASRVFLKAGIAVTPHAAPDIRKRTSSWTQRFPAFLELIAETVKIVWYRGQGWM